MPSFDFSDLFVLDLANNHQGSVEHGLNIIRGLGAVVRKRGVRAAIKFQFRELDSFIHPAHKTASDNKHIPRFLATRLSPTDYKILFDEARAQGLLTMCTPFDEASVERIESMGFDAIKIASCSARDWPLLEQVAQVNKPVIFSTGGLDLIDIDNLVSFFEHRGVPFAVMHCVSVYPTPPDLCQLNQIDELIDRYPGRIIGWSTHEAPDDGDPILVAYAKGARMFERHVGLPAEGITLNAYSSTPDQIDFWLSAHAKARSLCGASFRKPSVPVEQESLISLRRGVYARKALKAGLALDRESVFFAMPCLPGQLDSGQWEKAAALIKAVSKDAPIMLAQVTIPKDTDVTVIKTAIHEIKALLHKARVVLGSDFEVEYSHHHGIARFREVGAVLVTCVNREYCKKLIIQLPGQQHPSHFHKLKEETFQVLHGTLHLEKDGRVKLLEPGDTALVLPGVWHRFWTETGCVVEEVSTTHFGDDSVYADPMINRKSRTERKTRVDHWGRFQISLGNDAGSA